MAANEEIFRKKSLDRIASPDELDMYIKASNPRVWVLLAAVIVFLAGLIVWGALGKLETKVKAGCTVTGGKAAVLLSEKDFARLTDEAFVRIGERESGPILSVSGPFEDGDGYSAYALHLSGIQAGEWFYVIEAEIDGAEDGDCQASVVMEQISPITFVIHE